MTDYQQHRRRSSLAIWLSIVAILLPPLYVLSYGPALLLVKYAIIEPPYTAFNTFYKPLDYPCHASPAFNDAMRRYADLWVGK